MKKGRILVLVFCAMLMAVLCACGEMPEITNLTLDAANVQLNGLHKGLSVSVQYEFNDTVKKGNVIETVPSAGTPLEKRDEVSIVVSRGKAVTIPDCENELKAKAEEYLTKLTLNLIVIEEYNDDVKAGRVIKTIPEAGEQVEEKTDIELYVSLGSEYRTVSDYAEILAEKYIQLEEADGLTVEAEYEFSEDVPQGYVIKTSVGIGKKIPVYQTLTITVSKGAGVAFPDVVGGNVEDAKAALEAMGLNCEIQEEYGDAYVGCVIGAPYNAEDLVEEGETILLRVSKGREPIEVDGMVLQITDIKKTLSWDGHDAIAIYGTFTNNTEVPQSAGMLFYLKAYQDDTGLNDTLLEESMYFESWKEVKNGKSVDVIYGFELVDGSTEPVEIYVEVMGSKRQEPVCYIFEVAE